MVSQSFRLCRIGAGRCRTLEIEVHSPPPEFCDAVPVCQCHSLYPERPFDFAALGVSVIFEVRGRRMCLSIVQFFNFTKFQLCKNRGVSVIPTCSILALTFPRTLKSLFTNGQWVSSKDNTKHNSYSAIAHGSKLKSMGSVVP